jgi:hypothetical protein
MASQGKTPGAAIVAGTAAPRRRVGIRRGGAGDTGPRKIDRNGDAGQNNGSSICGAGVTVTADRCQVGALDLREGPQNFTCLSLSGLRTT